MKSILVVIMIVLTGCSAQKQTALNDTALQDSIRQTLRAAVQQYKYLSTIVPPGVLPRTFENGELKTIGSGGWVSGFYPGTLLYLFEYSKDPLLRTEALARLQLLKKEQNNTGTHDLGFMMYCSFGNANRIDAGKQYDSILLQSARSLSKRFDSTVGCIRSWNSAPSHFLVIIDNMMNLELLMYAFHQTQDSSFYKIAVSHANTTMKNHFRSDYSSYHVVDYDAATGLVQQKFTHQGYSDESAWARGQAWALYGYTMMFRETHDEQYLGQAKHIAGFILHHPNLPHDKVPYWDFDAPGIPDAPRDASAAAIISSALFELSGYVSGEAHDTYLATAATILHSLSNAPYRTSGSEAGGFLLQHSVGHYPKQSEVDVPLSYADYYFAEAALRYLRIQQ